MCRFEMVQKWQSNSLRQSWEYNNYDRLIFKLFSVWTEGMLGKYHILFRHVQTKELWGQVKNGRCHFAFWKHFDSKVCSARWSHTMPRSVPLQQRHAGQRKVLQFSADNCNLMYATVACYVMLRSLTGNSKLRAREPCTFHHLGFSTRGASAKGSQWQLALAFLSQVGGSRIEPDIITYNSTMAACDAAGRCLGGCRPFEF